MFLLIRRNNYNYNNYKYRFLKDLLTNISKGLNARLELRQISEKDQQHLEEAHNKKIETITNECVQVRKVNIGFFSESNFSLLDGRVFSMLAAHCIESGFKFKFIQIHSKCIQIPAKAKVQLKYGEFLWV